MKPLDFLMKKINNFFILPRDNSTEIVIDYPVTQFENLDPDDDLNVEARDVLIGEILKIMSRDNDIRNKLEFKESIIECKIKGDQVSLGLIRSDKNRFDEHVFFSGRKAYPLKVWLEEQVLTNEDVVELEKGLIKMI